MNKKLLSILISVGAVLICSLLVFTSIDHKIADLFQRPLESTSESKHVVMINVDDNAIDNIGTYPLNRDVYGDSLVVLRDAGASAAVFDMVFLNKGLAKIDEAYVSDNLADDIENVFNRYQNRQLSLEETEEEVMYSIASIIKNADDQLAGGLNFFGNSYMNIVFGYGEPSEDSVELLLAKCAIPDDQIIADNDTVTPEEEFVSPCIDDFIGAAGGAGCVNGNPDKDGYLRRVHLLRKYKGKYFGSLAFMPLLHYCGNPKIIVSDSKITLVDARIGDTTKTIEIPRDREGFFVMKFPKKQYDDYNAVSLWNIYRIHLIEQQVGEYVSFMSDGGYFNWWDQGNPLELMNNYMALRTEIFNGEDLYDSYKAEKDSFNSLVSAYLDDENIKAIAAKRNFTRESDEMALISDFTAVWNDYINSFNELSKIVGVTGESDDEAAAISIFGVLATSTTDFGINQYEERYPNTGAHYTVLNQILSEDFVDDSSPLFGIAIALVLCLLYALISNSIKSTGGQIVFGLFMIILTAGALLGVFLVTRVYVSTAVPLFSVALTFIITTVVGFLTASKDKKFITNAFGQCLSPAVVKEIVANPSSFKLGGQKLEMTAIFTDIQKFSSFSELLTASQLVALLNYYLTKMSDIIMDERGTVDKYEGDAIIALVGAPVKMDDHAERAAVAALKMKAAEKVMNEEIRNAAALPKPESMDDDLYDAFQIMVKNNKGIFTRIGLNSGEMIAGYMGSENKKNYTMMGNNVNLASRLEGVNKQYSTGGILCSEATRDLFGDAIVVRRLDRVRVVNVNTPIRLYEPMAERAHASEGLLKYIELWEQAMDTFEAGDYAPALQMFQRLSDANPSDNVAKYYIRLIDTFFVKGTYPKEADNFGVEYMPEDKVFKLLQK